MNKKIVLLGGRTGGPIIPLLAISDNLPEFEPVIFGIRSGFEQKISKNKQIPFYSFPETKFRIFTFKGVSLIKLIPLLFETLLTAFKLIYAFCLSIIRLYTIKPQLIASSGSFLAIPVIYAVHFLNSLGLVRIKIIIHQQDPLPGLANKYTAKFADILTCVFPRSKSTLQLKNAKIIPNPFDYNSFDKEKIDELETRLSEKTPNLVEFVKHTTKPLLLIFGGGSGSEFINNWVLTNIDLLLEKFNVIHITGAYARKSNISTSGYISYDVLLEEMKYALSKADVVISRCGMGSITELRFLRTPSYLIPLPNSHQELNASAVQHEFIILHQKDSSTWINTIIKTYPESFQELAAVDVAGDKAKLHKYYNSIRSLFPESAN